MSKETKRLKDLLTVTNVGLDWMTKAQSAEAKLTDLTALHPATEWTEADGAVLWWLVEDGKIVGPSIGKPTAMNMKFASPTNPYRRINRIFCNYWSRIPKVQLLAQSKEAK